MNLLVVLANVQLTSPGPEGPLHESWEASLRRELSGFRVWGFMVFGPGFRVVGLRFRVLGSAFSV